MNPKIYTRRGDTGTTALADGTRVGKDDLRVEAYGTVDELVAVMGLARAELTVAFGGDQRAKKLSDWLREAQEQAMGVASRLAGSPIQTDLASAVAQLENRIDELSESLPPLQAFLVPGRMPCEAVLHVARTVCRRAERASVRANAPGDVIAFLNRLSDFLFVAARYVTFIGGGQDEVWRR